MAIGRLAFPLLAVLLGAQQGASVIRRGPYVQRVDAKSALVCFETSAETEGAVECGGKVYRSPRGKRHEVQLKGLEPGARIRYVVQPGGLAGIFRTAPVKPDAEVAFIALGDTRSDHDKFRKIAAKATEDLPDFTLHTGDLVNNGEDDGQWDQFFKAAQPLLATGSFWPALGNHERQASQYFSLFALPEGERWYTFVYGPAQFFVLDSTGDLSRQATWLKAELAKSKARYRFAAYHHAAFASSPESSRLEEGKEIYQAWGKAFEDGGMTVAFQGHIHNYQRAEHKGVVYVTTAGGGAELYPLGPPLPQTKATAERHHYVRVKLSAKKMVLDAVDESGKVFDTHTVGSK